MIPKRAAPNTASSPTRGLRLCQVLAHVRHAWFYPIRNQGSCRVCRVLPDEGFGLVPGLPGPTWRKIRVCVGFAWPNLAGDPGSCRVCRVLPDEGFGLVPGFWPWGTICRYVADGGDCFEMHARRTAPFSALDKTPVKKCSVWNARKGTVPRRAFPDNLRGDGHGS